MSLHTGIQGFLPSGLQPATATATVEIDTSSNEFRTAVSTAVESELYGVGGSSSAPADGSVAHSLSAVQSNVNALRNVIPVRLRGTYLQITGDAADKWPFALGNIVKQTTDLTQFATQDDRYGRVLDISDDGLHIYLYASGGPGMDNASPTALARNPTVDYSVLVFAPTADKPLRWTIFPADSAIQTAFEFSDTVYTMTLTSTSTSSVTFVGPWPLAGRDTLSPYHDAAQENFEDLKFLAKYELGRITERVPHPTASQVGFYGTIALNSTGTLLTQLGVALRHRHYTGLH